MDMTKTDAVTPRTASGAPNVGLFIGFNLPIYHKKYQAGVHEAQERALADARLYEAQLDETRGEIKDTFTQARVQREVLDLLCESILPRARHALELARSDYETSNVDIATVLSAQREVLQVAIQVAQVEAELGKALASLERAVGCELKDHSLDSEPPTPEGRPARSTAPRSTPDALGLPARRGDRQGDEDALGNPSS
jgi:outer membrane protein TolC